MARPLRINRPGGWYHAMNRGLERRAVFSDDSDRGRFVDLLSELDERFGVEVHAWCLMSNHYHVALHTPRGNLSQGMQWLGQSYSGWFNHRHSRVGPLFQGRFRSQPVDPEDWLYRLSLYIHLNPVRTGEFGLGKRADRAEGLGFGEAPSSEEVTRRMRELRTYPWSSFRAYAGYARAPEWLRTSVILQWVGGDAEDARREYRRRAREHLARGIEESEFEQFRSRVALGSAAFVSRMKSLAGKAHRETERRSRLGSTIAYDRVVELVEKERGLPSEEWMHRHGDPGKWMVLWLARRRCGMTLAELGSKTGRADYAAVSTGIRRFDERLEQDSRLRKRMKRLLHLSHV